MAFSSDDILELLNIFHSERQDKRPFLVRDLSDEHLIRSDAVLDDFLDLLDTSEEIVALGALPARLNVKEIEWLLDDASTLICYARTHQGLLPTRAWQGAVNQFMQAAENGAAPLTDHATAANMSEHELRRLIAIQHPDVEVIALDAPYSAWLPSHPSYSCTSRFLQRVIDVILKRFVDADQGDQALNLNNTFPDWPSCLLSTGAEKALKHSTADMGYCDTDKISNEVYYYPKSYTRRIGAEHMRHRQAFVAHSSQNLHTKGFFAMETLTGKGNPNSSLVHCEDILAAYELKYGESALSVAVSSTRPPPARTTKEMYPYLITESKLLDLQELSRNVASKYAARVWKNLSPGEEAGCPLVMPEEYALNTEEPELFQCIFYSKHGKAADEAFNETISKLSTDALKHFQETVKQDLLIPVRLYVHGMEIIIEPTLHAHVSHFLKDHVGTELIPHVMKQIPPQLLIPRSQFSKDVDKLTQAIKDAKGLDILQAAIARFCRKQRIDEPDLATLRTAQQQVLQSKLRGMSKMKRGSDLLQNLTWILLAAATAAKGEQCLFTNSGKDTTRMIKFFALYSLTDDRVAKLEEYRSVVSERKDTDEVRREMREMAEMAVHGMLELELEG